MTEKHSDQGLPVPQEETCTHPGSLETHQRAVYCVWRAKYNLAVAIENLSIAISEAFPEHDGLEFLTGLTMSKERVLQAFDAAQKVD